MTPDPDKTAPGLGFLRPSGDAPTTDELAAALYHIGQQKLGATWIPIVARVLSRALSNLLARPGDATHFRNRLRLAFAQGRTAIELGEVMLGSHPDLHEEADEYRVEALQDLARDMGCNLADWGKRWGGRCDHPGCPGGHHPGEECC